MVTRARLFQWVYAGLWLTRVWFAFYGTGYIHPDEHMQNGEITAGNIIDLYSLVTWEWSSDFPIRSILPAFVTTGLPLLGLRLLFGPERLVSIMHPSHVFRIQRSVFLCLSGILDYSVSRLVASPGPRRLSLLLIASSYVTCTFQVRPFSNSLESILLALCLVLLRSIVDIRVKLRKIEGKDTGDRISLICALKNALHLLAALAVVGIFTRPTFVAFAIPIGYQALLLSYKSASSSANAIRLLLPPCCTAMLTASLFIGADTYYFRHDFSEPVVTPYNFVKYNLSTGNLAEHGLHPNWLHIGVNLPMLLGPLIAWLTWRSMKENFCRRRHQKVHFEADVDILRQTLIQIIVLSLSVLSSQPHQEPRFLTPLVLPMIILAATAESPPAGEFFLVTWIVFNVALACVFGVLHQGGVVPSLLAFHSKLRDIAGDSTAHVIYWKTYMPPRHLLGMSRRDVLSGRILFVDLAGAPLVDLTAALCAASSNVTYLVTPVPVFLALPRGISPCITLEASIFPHLDPDHLPESFRAAARDGLRLGVYTAECDCITDALVGQT